jgi:hypothetical protein
LLLATIRLPRMSVQRLSAVEVIVGVALRFVFAAQVQSCGGGGSLSEEFKLSPTALLRKSESSRPRCPPELVLAADRVALGERVRDGRLAVAVGADVEAGVVEAGGVNVIPLAALCSLGKEAVAAEQAGVVDGQVVAVPAVRLGPPDLVAAVLGVGRRAVEVADGQVLDPDIARPHRDPVHALPVAAVDDDPVAIQPP